MNSVHYNRLWQQIGKYLVIVILATWATLQGAPDLFGISGNDKRKTVAALFGIVACAPMLIVVAHSGRRFAMLHASLPWHSRIPISFLKGVDTSTKDGQLLQLFFLVAYVLVPAAGLLHFLRIVLNTKIVRYSDRLSIGHFDFHHIDWAFGDSYRIDEKDGVTYFPVFEPAFLIIICLLAWASAAGLLVAIFRKRQP